MATSMKNLTFVRGDTQSITFGLTTDNGGICILQEGDMLYFTVKKSFDEEDFVLQRKFGKGITYNPTTLKYEIEITQENTCELPCGNYVYDIKAKLNSDGETIVKTLVKGVLTLDSNATHKGNE